MDEDLLSRIEGRATGHRTKAFLALDEDKDAAVQAVKLEKDTGADAGMIYANKDAFVKDYTSYMTDRMLDRNPGLANYINAHPMAAIVSKDDWNRMADFYDKLDYYTGVVGKVPHVRAAKGMIGAAYGAMQAFSDSFWHAPVGGWLSKQTTPGTKSYVPETAAFVQEHPYIAEAAKAAVNPLETAFQLLSSLPHAFAGAGQGLALGMGASEQTARRVGREFGGWGEYATSELVGTGFHGPAARPILEVAREARQIANLSKMLEIPVPEAAKALRAAEPYLNAQELPPPGTHPVWDGVIAENVKQNMSVYDALVDATNKSNTLVSSPELMEVAAKQGLENQPVFIHWDAIRRIYGDKVPEAGDGLLGDVPGFAEQFRNAIENNTDVMIRMPEWLAYTSKELKKELHDDVRLRQTDPTLNEVKEFPTIEQAVKDLEKPTPPAVEPPALPEEPGARMQRLRDEYKQALDERSPSDPLVKTLRAISGYEWKPEEISKAVTWAELNGRTDIVDRALEMARLTDPQVGARLETELQNLKRHRDAQNAVNRELNTQMFSIEDWMTVDATITTPEYKSIKELMESGEWQRVGATTVAKVTPEYLQARDTLRTAMDQLLTKLVGKGKPSLAIAEQIRHGSVEAPTPAQGMYLSYQGLDPVVAIALNALDPTSTLRHEVIHHFRTYGYFTRQEWSTLRDMVVRDKLIQKHRLIEKGYGREDVGRLIEEAVAHEWQEWSDGKFRPKDTAVGRIFQKIKDFFENFRIALKELFGGRLSEQEIFQSIASGKIGQRGPGEPLFGAKDIREAAAKFPELEVPKVEEAGPAFLGLLPKDRYAQWQRLIDKQNAKDVKKLFDVAARDVRKRLTPEWKANYAEQYKQSIEDIKNRPDFRAAAFFRNGILGEGKLEGLPKLDPTFLTKEQKDALPPSWMRQRDGFNPDQLANFFGYASGNEMIDALVRLENAKGRTKASTFLDLQASAEAERRMQAKYGDLDEAILKEAREHAIGIERFDLMHEEYLAMGQMLGQAMPLSKKDLRDQAWHQFNESTNSQVPLIKYMRDLGKSNKATEAAWLKGDALGAFVERQHALRLQALAELAKKFEKKQAAMDRIEKRYSKREVEGHPPEYTNWIHHILNRIGLEIRDPGDLAMQISKHDADTLKKFVDSRKFDGLPEDFELVDGEWNPSLPVWQKLIDEPDFVKHKDALTVGEFEAVLDSIQALDKIGRQELMTILEGQAVERDAVLNKMVEQFEETGKEKYPAVGDMTTAQKLKSTGLRLNAGLLQMEYIWTQLDKKPYGGVFWKTFTKPFAEAGNEYRILIRDYSRALTKLGKEATKGVNMKEKIHNDVLMEPLAGKPDEAGRVISDRPLGNGYVTRASFRTAMLYTGLESGLEKLARGYHSTPEKVMEWINKHATEKDWAYARGVWKLFDELQDKADLVAMNMHGVTMRRLPKATINTTLHGPIEGGYYPMIYDQTRGGGGKGGKIDPNLPSNVRVLTDRGYELERTSYVGPVSLSLSHVTYEMTRHIRDIAFREVLTETQKYWKNQKFTNAMTKHMGPHTTGLLIPYLRDIAGVRGPTSGALGALENTLSFVTQNTIGTLVGWNPGTLIKHNLTAFIQSFKELKNKSSLLAAAWDLYGGTPTTKKANHAFIDEGGMVGKLDWSGSAEIQGRRPHWFETFGGASDVVSGKNTIRRRLAQIYSAPIARVDQAVSKMLWLAKYREMMEEFNGQMTVEKAHAESAAVADQAVRRTHGSTAITSRPAFMRNPWLSPFTALYGFFNHIFNRMYEMSWQGRDLARDIKAGEATTKDVGHLASQFWYAIAVPALVEEAVTPLFDKEDRSLLTRFAMGMVYPVFSAFPMVREVAHGVLTGHDPAVSILAASYKAVSDMNRAIQGGKFDADTFGDTLAAVNTLSGVAAGVSTQQIGRWQKFAWNYFVNQSDQPQSAAEWYRALRYGTSRERRH